jgi:pilus assembly protein CpaC
MISLRTISGRAGRTKVLRRGLCLAACVLAMGMHTRGQQAPPARAPEARQEVVANEASEKLHLLVGRSLVLSSPRRLRRVSIADPAIADAVILSPTEVLVNGKAPGGVSLVFWDDAEHSRVYELSVDLDIAALRQRLREVFPGEPVHVEAARDVVTLAGRVSSKDVADRIYQLAAAAVPKVVSFLEVPAPPQRGEILLEVKFAEVDRSALSQFGFTFISVPGTTTRTLAVTGTEQFGQVGLQSLQTGASGSGANSLGQTNLTLSDLLNIFVFRPDINLGATIRALQQKNLLQILAEPNLLTETGKEANFLAGGEFPFPVIQGGAAGTIPTVSVQFKEFGVRLTFTPELTEDGQIHLKVKPEVSALDFTNALTISGFFIPALSTRRVETQVELRDGQSFAIAGLVDDRVTRVTNKVPGLGDLPVLGQLFRSQSFNKSKTELLVLVTPRIVHPLAPSEVPAGPAFPEKAMPPAAPEPEKKPAPKK